MAVTTVVESTCDRCGYVERARYQQEPEVPKTWAKVNIWVGQQGFFHLCPKCKELVDKVLTEGE